VAVRGLISRKQKILYIHFGVRAEVMFNHMAKQGGTTKAKLFVLVNSIILFTKMRSFFVFHGLGEFIVVA
jgi:uncharacterized membrane protein YwzB